jgi:hypothetical protein
VLGRQTIGHGPPAWRQRCPAELAEQTNTRARVLSVSMVTIIAHRSPVAVVGVRWIDDVIGAESR